MSFQMRQPLGSVEESTQIIKLLIIFHLKFDDLRNIESISRSGKLVMIKLEHDLILSKIFR